MKQSEVRAMMAGLFAKLARPAFFVPCGFVLGYALLGFLLVPALVSHYVPQWVRENLGAESTIGVTRFNPFLFRLEVRDFALHESDSGPVLGFEALRIDFELSSLVNRAWTFAEAALIRPRFDLVMEPDGRLNLQRLLEALPTATAPASEDPLPRTIVQQVVVEQAQVHYTDRRSAEPVALEVGPVNVRLAEIATLPAHEGTYTLRADLPGGATAVWEGRVTLHPVSSAGSLQLEGFRPGAFWDLLAPYVALEVPEGVAALQLDYEATLDQSEWRVETRAMRLEVRDLRLRRRGTAAPMLELAAADFADGRFSLAERALTMGSIRIADGRVGAGLDASGALDWAALIAPAADPAGAPAQDGGAGTAPFTVQLPKVLLENLSLDFYDETRRAPMGIALQARQVDFAAALAFGAAETEARISNARAQFDNLALTTGVERKPLGSIAKLQVEDGSLDLAAQRVTAANVKVEALRTAIRRHADGTIREVDLVSSRDLEVPLPISHAARAWQATVGEFRVSGIDLDYADEVSDPPVEYSVRGGSLALQRVNTGSIEPLAVALRLPIAQGGSIALTGSAIGDGSAADVRLRIDGLSLLAFAPLIAERTTLALGSGTLGADAKVAYRGADSELPTLAAEGTFGIDGLMLNEADGGERLLAWHSAAASGVEFSLGPDRLRVHELRLEAPGVKFVINKDRTTNLAGVLRDSESESVTPAGSDMRVDVSAGATPTAPQLPGPLDSAVEEDADPFPVRIDRVRIDGGTIDFADFSLLLPFVARIESLKGAARGISSSADDRATLAFGGRVGEFGEADIDGQLALFDPEQFTDVDVSFRNVALSSLSPYTATFAGWTIDGGDLDLGLEYKVDQGRLSGENQAVLQDLRLGSKVDSPGATALPLDLAVALLTDADGRINLTVPVTGNLSDPQFSYGGLVWQALRTMIGGVVTAPFKALGSLFDHGDDEGLQTIRFKSGSHELTPRERERVAEIAKALAPRPRLGIAVVPGVESERDGYAVRRLEVRRAHAAELGFDLEPGEDPGPVSYSDPASQRVLEALLDAREGKTAADRFAEAWAAQNGGNEPAGVNPVLARVGRGGGDPAMYRAMYLQLVRSLPEPSAALAALGRGRAEAVVAELVERGLDGSRVSIAAPRALTQAQPAGVLLPLDLVPVDRLNQDRSNQVTLSAISE